MNEYDRRNQFCGYPWKHGYHASTYPCKHGDSWLYFNPIDCTYWYEDCTNNFDGPFKDPRDC